MVSLYKKDFNDTEGNLFNLKSRYNKSHGEQKRNVLMFLNIFKAFYIKLYFTHSMHVVDCKECDHVIHKINI